MVEFPMKMIVAKSCSFDVHGPGLIVYRTPFLENPQSGRIRANPRPIGTRSNWTTDPGIEIPGCLGEKTTLSVRQQRVERTSVDTGNNDDPEESQEISPERFARFSRIVVWKSYSSDLGVGRPVVDVSRGS